MRSSHRVGTHKKMKSREFCVRAFPYVTHLSMHTQAGGGGGGKHCELALIQRGSFNELHRYQIVLGCTKLYEGA